MSGQPSHHNAGTTCVAHEAEGHWLIQYTASRTSPLDACKLKMATGVRIQIGAHGKEHPGRMCAVQSRPMTTLGSMQQDEDQHTRQTCTTWCGNVSHGASSPASLHLTMQEATSVDRKACSKMCNGAALRQPCHTAMPTLMTHPLIFWHLALRAASS